MARKRKPNPVLQKKYTEGYVQGKKDGITQAVNFFADKLEALQHTKGIGPKTLEKIVEVLGHKYFDDKFIKGNKQ